ncbi:MAG: TonB-dependent receptor, partial [Pseudomonadota bacterium]
VQALIGVEYREERLTNQADATNQDGLLVGAGGPVLPTDAETELFEVFFEGQVPLVQDLPFAEEITLTGAYRFSTYESFDDVLDVAGGDFDINTFSVGLSWVPVEDLRLRGQFQRAIRAPNIFELFAPLNTGLVNLTDPCSGLSPTATAAACLNTGLPTSLFGLVPPDSGQLNTFGGGNPDLEPEESDTFTVGAIIQPRQIDGLSISIDYFDIDVEDFITNIPAGDILSGCLASGDPSLCAFISRSPLDGSLTQDGSFISTNQQNIGGLSTSGLDFQINYGFDAFGYGDVSLNYVSTVLFDLLTQSQPTSQAFDCAGLFDNACGTPNPEYRHNFTFSYNTPYNVRLSALWRYFAGTDAVGTLDTTNPDTPAITTAIEDGADPDVRDNQIGTENFLDLAAFWDATDHLELRFGVNNVFDNNAPIVNFNTSGTNGNTFPSVFQSTGRFIFVGARLSF